MHKKRITTLCCSRGIWGVMLFQVKKLLNKVVLRESCFYRKLTDASQDEESPEEVEAPQEDMLGRSWFY